MRHIMITAALVVLGGCSSNGNDGESSSGWGNITEAYIDAEVSVLRVQFSRAIVNPGSCEGGDFYVRELDDSPAAERFMRTVIDAHLAGRKVKFWIEGCSKSQWWGKTRPLIYDLYIDS